MIATVEYGLAPDHPFPAGPIDSLSATLYFVEQPGRSVHIAGESSGALMASVTALEIQRKYPGRIKR